MSSILETSRHHKMQGRWSLWLITTMALVVIMMVVGAATRLTQSGLSMVEWRPLFGILPPLDEGEWVRILELYRQTSQYQLMNAGMSLDAFKEIFWWEYIHRVLGRLIGIVYGLPFLWWLLRRRLPPRQFFRLFLLLILGGLQGVIGWWMVKSGFVDRTEVSQYRLVVHLGMAFLILGLLVWTYLSMKDKTRFPSNNAMGALANLPLLLISLTILAGAIVAGSRAGFVFNEWPLIDGQIWPHGYWPTSLGWHAAFIDLLTVQMNHRLLAYVTLLVMVILTLMGRGKIWGSDSAFLTIILFIQAMLGIVTLLSEVALILGIAHQFLAAILFIYAVKIAYSWR